MLQMPEIGHLSPVPKFKQTCFLSVDLRQQESSYGLAVYLDKEKLLLYRSMPQAEAAVNRNQDLSKGVD